MKIMKKLITVFLLLLLIIIASAFSLLYLSFNVFEKNNYLNKNYRLKIAHNLFLRKIFKLNQPGDARSDYASNRNFTNLDILVYSPQNLFLDENVKKSLPEKIRMITGKTGQIIITEDSLEDFSSVNDEDLKSLIKTHPVNFGKNAVLRIFLLPSYDPVPTYAGLVMDPYSIFLFEDSIANISHFEKNSDNAQISTVLHEFAHLLGAGHVKQEGCILSESVEDIKYGRPEKISADFCPADLEEIHRSASL